MKTILNIILIVFLLSMIYCGVEYLYSLAENTSKKEPQKREIIEIIPSQPGDFKAIGKAPIVIKAVSYQVAPKNEAPEKNTTPPGINESDASFEKVGDAVPMEEKTEGKNLEEATVETKQGEEKEEGVKTVKTEIPVPESKTENANPSLKTNPLLRFGDHCYRIFEEDTTWKDARKKCEVMGGYLACIESKPENDFLFNSVKNIDGLVLLGAFYDEEEKKWKWTNNSLFIYYNWSGKQPESVRKNAHRMVYSPLNGKDKWFFYSGAEIQGFICEWDEEPEKNIETTEKIVAMEEKPEPIKKQPVIRFKNLAEFEILLTKVGREYRETFYESESSLSFKEHLEDLKRLKFLGRNLQSEVIRMGVKGDINIPRYTFILQDTIEKARRSVNLKSDPGDISLSKKYKPSSANDPNVSNRETRLIRQAAVKDAETAMTHLREMIVIIKEENEK
ncbi:MAG: hypothetical protein A2017_11215 [Lentisphaerae bacterium GWF2_44_16]|nr:MAG: hypothetical protein A2017_11215 [Lentisphaerae bacterium GWF2_44_16]